MRVHIPVHGLFSRLTSPLMRAVDDPTEFFGTIENNFGSADDSIESGECPTRSALGLSAEVGVDSVLDSVL